MAKVALGKGLGALIKTHVVSPTPAVENGERVQLTALAEIIASPLQPRTHFTETAIDELVESIKQHGIIQPLIVRRRGAHFELIAGERRWRAATRLGLAEAPVIVREASDQDVLELALIENLQREDLNAIEEARAFTLNLTLYLSYFPLLSFNLSYLTLSRSLSIPIHPFLTLSLFLFHPHASSSIFLYFSNIHLS